MTSDGDMCAECGAVTDKSCQDLFERLLALDHSRQAPWGRLHGVVVACYRLQHPASLVAGEHGILLDLLRAYVDGRVDDGVDDGVDSGVDSGVDAVWSMTERARSANSHRVRKPTPAGGTVPDPVPAGFAVTIGEVAAGGGFPADGHAERVHAWAKASLAGYTNVEWRHG